MAAVQQPWQPRTRRTRMHHTSTGSCRHLLSSASAKAAERAVLASNDVAMLPHGEKYRSIFADQASRQRAVTVASDRCGIPSAKGVAWFHKISKRTSPTGHSSCAPRPRATHSHRIATRISAGAGEEQTRVHWIAAVDRAAPTKSKSALSRSWRRRGQHCVEACSTAASSYSRTSNNAHRQPDGGSENSVPTAGPDQWYRTREQLPRPRTKLAHLARPVREYARPWIQH